MTSYEIHLRPEAAEDIERLGKGDQRTIIQAIKERLGSHPEEFGKPLTGPLKGLRRIRFGDYRIAYQVAGRKVILWAVKNRKEVYGEVLRRFLRRAGGS